MSEEGNNKKYYWLKLDRGFFKRHDIRIIQSMENGKDYILFYLKLLVESIDHEGSLRFNETVPYNAKMLSVITDTNIDTVQKAIEIFTELGMMQTLDDGTIFMQETQKMLGTSYVDSDVQRENARLRKQRQREREKQAELLKNGDVTDMSRDSHGTSHGEIDKEIDKELEIKSKSKRKELDSLSSAYGAKSNVFLTEEEFAELKNKIGEDKIERELDYYSEQKWNNDYLYSSDYEGMLRFNKRLIAANEAKRKAQEVADKDDLMMQEMEFVPEW